MNENVKHWYQKWWGVFLIVILVFFTSFFVASVFYIINFIKSGAADTYYLKNNDFDQEYLKLVKGEKNYQLGPSDAPITIVEFSDFACLFSKQSFSKIREINIKYQGQVKFIFRDLPIITDYSADLALAARCAGDQGLFWLMHDKLFINQGVSEKNELIELANQIGADTERFQTCINNNKFLPQIEKDFADAGKLEITGTPTWFINGYKIGGNIPENIFIKIIEDLLNN